MLREFAIQRCGCHELRVRPLPHDATVVEHHDVVAVDDGREPVRDHDERAASGDGIDCLTHPLLVEPIERRCRLVEQQDRRGGEQRAGDGQALTFAAREHDPVFADGGVKAEWISLEHLAEIHRAQHLLALDVACVGGGEAQVVTDRAGEGRGILFDITQLRSERGAVERADVATLEENRAAGRVVEALDEGKRGAFAGAGGANDCHACAAGDPERDALEDFAGSRTGTVAGRTGTVAGKTVAGKTGTAEIPTPFGYTSSVTNTSFVGWGPAEDPKFLVYVWLEKPTISIWGSEVAAPVFSKVVQNLVVLMDIPPDPIRLQASTEDK